MYVNDSVQVLTKLNFKKSENLRESLKGNCGGEIQKYKLKSHILDTQKPIIPWTLLIR